MGFILTHLHARGADGISNQMQAARGMGPDSAVRWWKKRGMRPPEIDPYSYFRQRIGWRYLHGVIVSVNKPQMLFVANPLSYYQIIQTTSLISCLRLRLILMLLIIVRIAGSDCGCLVRGRLCLTGRRTPKQLIWSRTTKCCLMYLLQPNDY